MQMRVKKQKSRKKIERSKFGYFEMSFIKKCMRVCDLSVHLLN